MADYNAPVQDMRFTLDHVVGLADLTAPDDHLGARPDRGVVLTTLRRVLDRQRGPSRRLRWRGGIGHSSRRLSCGSWRGDGSRTARRQGEQQTEQGGARRHAAV